MKSSVESKDIYSLVDIQKLYEETINSLKVDTWTRVARSIRGKKSIYLGCTKKGVLKFKTQSRTIAGKWWYQHIEFKDKGNLKELQKLSPKLTAMKIIEMLMKGDILVSCNDPSFKYYWSYKAWVNGYGLKVENRFPFKRNPKLSGSVCGHLYQVLTVLPFHIPKIVQEYRSKGLLD